MRTGWWRICSDMLGLRLASTVTSSSSSHPVVSVISGPSSSSSQCRQRPNIAPRPSTLVIVEPAIVTNAGAVRKKTHLLGWRRYAGPGQLIVFDQVPVLSSTLGMVVVHCASLPLTRLWVVWTSSTALRQILLVVSAR